VLREGRTAKPAEFKLFRKDGSRVFVQTEASIVLHNGYPVAIQGIGRDITERKQAEEALNESEEKFRGLAEHMNAASGIVQGKKFLYANEYMAQMLGYTVDEILSLEFTQLVHPEDRSRMIELARKRQSGEPVPGNYEFKALTKTGEMKWMDFSVGTMIYRGRPAIIGTGIDITERKRNEERLDAYTKGFQLLTDSSTRLLSTDCAGDTLHDIFDKLADHLKARVYVCYLVSTDGSRLQLHCQRGLAPAIVQLIESIDFNRTLCGIVAQQKRPIFVENVQRSAEPKAALLRLLGTRAYACHPLLGHKGLIGTLSFLADDRDRFSKDEVEFMRIASHQAAMALEHQRLADELSRRALELTKANSAKDHFMAILSHELRTPLTPVVMGISMLQDRKDLDASMRETLEMVRRNVEMEARLIDDLLDVTKIARGKIEMNRKLADLRPIIDRAVEVCMPDIEARKLNFGVEIEKSEVLFLEDDSARLQQVIWNLLKNAVKFTPKGGCVGIRCFRDREQVAVEINDSGIGIEPEALPRIFNAFEQAEHSITRQFGGLGLGLAISKAIVELHGGNITAESPGRNKGATFRVRLPLVKLGKQPFSDMRKEAEPVPTRPLRILLVEDHAITAQMIKTLLNEKGHAVQVAGDMSAALELANTNRFDLILSDLGLPDGSGHELMVKLRSQGLKTPGIALSGYGQEDDIKQSYQAGFAAHLIKPASREAIMDAVASVAAGDGDSNSYSSTIH
jgi:PAS domain S-box-containing protein